mmetsp:Transcript_15840/g.23826  ORF Transcript_15840/g.23826 Transcript_15840/m.23826 type:complete len:335 (+) Transcript_15840:243-1247(+)
MNQLQQFNHTPGDTINDSEVTDTDVLSGRGNGVAYREGNIFYSRLIKENQDEYQNHANTKRKKQIATGIIDIIKSQEPPGRFLKSKKHEAFVWVVQNDHFAMKKVTQALREKPKTKAAPAAEKKPTEEKVPEEGERDSIRKRSMKNHSSKILIESIKGGDEEFPIVPDLVTSDSASAQVEKVVNPNYRPMKRSVKGDSKQRYYKWMSSISRLKLLQNSVQSIGPDGNEEVSPEEVQDAMLLLSSDNFDGEDDVDTDDKDGSDGSDGCDEKPSSAAILVKEMSFKSFSTIGSNIKDDDLRDAMLKLASENINLSMANLNISKEDVTDKKSNVVPV